MSQSVEGLKAAADLTKQIITLATGVAGLTVTFAKEFKRGTDLPSPLALQLSWVFSTKASICPSRPRWRSYGKNDID